MLVSTILALPPDNRPNGGIPPAVMIPIQNVQEQLKAVAQLLETLQNSMVQGWKTQQWKWLLNSPPTRTTYESKNSRDKISMRILHT